MSELKLRTDDTVFHRPTGETWVVAVVNPHNPKEFLACGWPETLGQVADCELVEAATDAASDKALELVATLQGLRGSWARETLRLRSEVPR